MNITVPLKTMGSPLILRENIATASDGKNDIHVSKAIGSGALIVEVDGETYALELQPLIHETVLAHERRIAEGKA